MVILGRAERDPRTQAGQETGFSDLRFAPPRMTVLSVTYLLREVLKASVGLRGVDDPKLRPRSPAIRVEA